MEEKLEIVNFLFKKIERYKKETQLWGHNNAFSYYDWGYSLFRLAKIKENESFFRESFEKFEKAIQLDPKYTFTYSLWGYSLFLLARNLKDESLFRESVDKFEKAKNDILDILVMVDKKDIGYILKSKILYPLLNSNTDEGRFFKEATKKINKNDLDKYKEAYILSVIIISQLHVNNYNEKLVSHYGKKATSQKLLFSNSKFRLNAINYSNDPSEGKTLLDYLFYENEKVSKETLDIEYIAFVGCFTFNYDSLNQFRLYGKEENKEGTGLSLLFGKNFFSEEIKMATKKIESKHKKYLLQKEEKYTLFRCIYLDPVTKRVETVGQKDEYLFYRENYKNVINKNKKYKKQGKYKEYEKYINDIINSVREQMEKLKKIIQDLDIVIIGQLLINLRYLTKHIAFKEEQECRIVKIHSLKDKKVEIEPDDDFTRMYIEYKPIVSKYIKGIYFGPHATGMELFNEFLSRKAIKIFYEKSKNPLA
jgi:hypothetical protein